MSETVAVTETDRDAQRLEAVADKPWPVRVATYLRLSGPGFLQSACTIGGGTLGASLFLGVAIGIDGLWIQPLAMVLGIAMLTVIAYVTLTTGMRPFRAINEHVSPVLGWAWLIATIAANMIWGLPQYNLAAGALTQNVAPSLLGPGTPLGGESGMLGMALSAALMATFAVLIIWFYRDGGWGVRLFESFIKLIVSLIVLCFVAVVVMLGVNGDLALSEVVWGFVPKPQLLFEPAAAYQTFLDQAGPTQAYWRELITDTQRTIIFAAVATAVGVNMTFLLPYSMLARGWGRVHRGLAGFDLFIGLLIPFTLVTACVVVASDSVFHGQVDEADVAHRFVLGGDDGVNPQYRANLSAAVQSKFDAAAWNGLDDAQRAAALDDADPADRALASMLVKRSDKDLAQTLTLLFGQASSAVFGIGVFFIALSTVVIHMLINGYAVCEALGKEPRGLPWRIGSLLPVVCVVGPFFWGDMAAYLVVPTSVIGLMLLPVAFWSFFLMLNSRSMLGDARPRGAKGAVINIVVGSITVLFTVMSLWAMWGGASSKGTAGRVALIAALVALLAAVVLVHVLRRDREPTLSPSP